jgi:cytochrome oxidase Cu insertion factor (SCO1/SenC/PrrC family)/thiol-disulfide isomerase/thioredoxin
MIPRRLRIGLTAGAALAAILLIAASVLATLQHKDQSTGTTAADTPATAPLATGTELVTAPRAPDVSLLDQHGDRVSLRSFRGKWVVLASAMTLCQEVCPMTTGALTQLQAQLRAAGLAKKVVVAELTVDPWRDDPQRLRAYQKLTGTDLTMLTGSPAHVRSLWKFFGVAYYKVPEDSPPQIDWMTHQPLTFDVDHTDGLFIVNPSGREVLAEEGMANVHGKLGQDLAHQQMAWTSTEVLDDLDHFLGRPASAAGSATDARAASAPTQQAALTALAGSPRPLQTLHGQSDRLLGSVASLQARIRSLRGYPIVVNAWASWCTDCQAEYPLLADASVHYGKKVAFIGVDVNDSASSAVDFIDTHRLSYPSYTASSKNLPGLADLIGMPTTIFINRAGKVTEVHTGEYDAQSTLDDDIQHYALGVSTVSSSS